MASAAYLISPQDPSKKFTFTIHPIMIPSINEKIEDALITNEENSSEWYDTIFNYLKSGTFPEPTTKKLCACL